MDVRRQGLSGLQALQRVTALQRRVRQQAPRAGVWEAADLQWWWRRPRASDEVEQLFWADASGPVAAFWLTEWGDTWQGDPVLQRGVAAPPLAEVWAAGLARATELGVPRLEVPVHDDDAELLALVEAAGLSPGYTDTESWLEPAHVVQQPALADGFRLVDREVRAGRRHWLADRNGDGVAERLAACSLYRPSLDLAVETDDGEVAAYALFWADPTTLDGLVEPVRVLDAWQRRGLARALLAEGIARLTARGVRRTKICYGAEDAGSLYRSVGFVPTARTTWHAGPLPGS